MKDFETKISQKDFRCFEFLLKKSCNKKWFDKPLPFLNFFVVSFPNPTILSLSIHLYIFNVAFIIFTVNIMNPDSPTLESLLAQKQALDLQIQALVAKSYNKYGMSEEVKDDNPYSRLMALKKMGIVENYA